MTINGQRQRGNIRSGLKGLLGVALMVAGVALQRNRSNNNNRQGDVGQEDQRQAGGRTSDRN